MPSQPDPATSLRVYFGGRLRSWRQLRGWTQRELGQQLGYDHTHLSKVESGHRRPPPDLPARADELLGTGGELAELWPLLDRERLRDEASGGSTGGSTGDGAGWDAGAGTLPAGPPDAHALSQMELLLQAYAGAGSELGGRDLVAAVEHHTRTVVQWQADGTGRDDTVLLGLAARYAQLAGWVCFDGSDCGRAMFWYRTGQHLATLAGEPDVASWLLSRQGTIHWATGNAAGAVTLGVLARQVGGICPSVEALARLVEARGHALASDQRACEANLAAAADLVGADTRTAPAAGEQRIPGLADEVMPLVVGTCYRDLAVRARRPQLAVRAIEPITHSLASVAARARRDRAVVAIRLASAHECADQPEEAAAVLGDVVQRVAVRGSARVLTQLRTVHDRLSSRWPDLGAVREVTARMEASQLLAAGAPGGGPGTPAATG